MDFEQASSTIKNFVNNNPSLFFSVEVDFPFWDGRPPMGDWTSADNLGMLVTGDGIGSQSGLYFFALPDKEIIYIGKATKNNLHNRVWDHAKTPVEISNGKKTFPMHGFGSCTHAPEEVALIRNGEAHLGVVTISDPILVSLLEVYLHTVHVKQYGKLPILNKQIG